MGDTVRPYGGAAMKVRLGQVRQSLGRRLDAGQAVHYCVPPSTIQMIIPHGQGLKRKFGFKKILNWVRLKFVSDSEQSLTQPILKSFFKPNFLFKLHWVGGNSLQPPFGFILIDFESLGTQLQWVVPCYCPHLVELESKFCLKKRFFAHKIESNSF